MVYVTGDTHGSFERFLTRNFPQQKAMTKDDIVIILGDFGGVWQQVETASENSTLDWLDEKSFTTVFVDGNHCNFDRLNNEFEEVDFCGGRAHKIRDSVYHLMRGYVFTFDNHSFFAFGGASSHDIQDGILNPDDYADDIEFLTEYSIRLKRRDMFRVKGVSWWPEELPNEEEMERGRQALARCGNKVDFVVSHCLPQSVSAELGYKDSDVIVKYFQNLLDSGLTFSEWYCGHYHVERRLHCEYQVLYGSIMRII